MGMPVYAQPFISVHSVFQAHDSMEYKLSGAASVQESTVTAAYASKLDRVVGDAVVQTYKLLHDNHAHFRARSAKAQEITVIFTERRDWIERR